MADTGWLPASVAYQSSAVWTNPTNIYATDAAVASCNTTGTAETGYLWARAFTGLSIPAGAVINGIEGRIRAAITSGAYSYSYAFIHLTSGFESWTTMSADGVSVAPIDMTASLVDYTFGGPTSLWGGVDTNGDSTVDRGWQSTDFDQYAGIGFAFAGSVSSTFTVDSVALKVYYTTTSSAGANSPGSTSTVDNGAVNWSNAGNITSSNDSRATCTVSGTTQSDGLVASNFGFAIPATATITGITVEIEKNRTGGSTGQVRDNTVSLRKAGSNVGDNKGTSTNWPTSEAYVTHGGPYDLWGTTWTPAEINSSGFGVYLTVQGAASGANRVANVDHIRVTVRYLTASGVNAATAIFWAFP